ncbi:MAG TPA: hypothetical protein DCY20_02520 [Firmicutes bacterium]|nr:hypothetical protein [Bacillota bacterium]
MKQFKILCLCLFVLCCFSTKTVSAQQLVKNIRFEENIELGGILSSSSKYFYVDEYQDVKNISLNLFFTKSELLDKNNSSITIYLNDIPVSSYALAEDKVYKDQITIDIPVELIFAGYNNLKIEAFKTITDKLVCSEDNSSANWLMIHEETNLSMSYEILPFDNNLSDYERIFMTVDEGQQLNTQLVLGNEFTSKQLTAALLFSTDIGKKIQFNNVETTLVPYDNVNTTKDLIFIGTENNTPTELLNLLTEDERSRLNTECLIKIVDSPFTEGKKLLLLISNNEDLLINAAKLMGSNDYVQHLKQSSIMINQQTPVLDTLTSTTSNNMTFKELGYENIYVKGPFTQEVNIDLYTPKSKVVLSGSKLTLNLKYADNLDFNRSLVTVYVNDIPVGSQQLKQENHEQDTLEIELPDELLNKTYYQIKIVFNLELLDLQCVTRDMDTPWAYITSDSMLSFVYGEQNDLYFSNYPYPFIQDNMFNDLTVVIPSELSVTGLSELSNMMVYMGRDLLYNTGDLNVVTHSEFDSSMQNNNLFIYGTAANNSVIQSLNNHLNIKYNSDFSKLGNEELVKFFDEVGDSIGTLQLIASPYNQDKSAIVVTSPSETQLSLSTKYLSDLSLGKSLVGDTIIVYPNGNVEDLVLLSSNQIDHSEKKQTNFGFVLQQETIGFVIIASLLFVTLGVTAWLIIRRQRR